MKFRFWMLMALFVGAFAMAACGGGNNSSGDGDECGDECSNECGDDEPATPADKRQALADKMKAAGEALDAEALKGLFPEDEHETVQQRMGSAWEEMKADGDSQTVEIVEITEVDGKHRVKFKITQNFGGQEEIDEPYLNMVEKDGEWYLTFKQ